MTKNEVARRNMRKVIKKRETGTVGVRKVLKKRVNFGRSGIKQGGRYRDKYDRFRFSSSEVSVLLSRLSRAEKIFISWG